LVIKEIVGEIENSKIEANNAMNKKINNAFESIDFQEGYNAFLEKRKAEF
jgi:enoyl-CoA hydratase/carnithine racemase